MIRHFQISAILVTFLFVVLEAAASLSSVTMHNSQIDDDRALIVVHPYSDWDFTNAAKPAVDMLVDVYKRSGHATVYVLDGSGTDGLYLKDQNPTYFLDASTGQFFNILVGQSFFFAGGSWSYCLVNAITSVIANTTSAHLTLTVFMDASFEFMQEESIADSLSALSSDSRKTLLFTHFDAVANRASSEICLDIFYEGTYLGKTSGTCRRTGQIRLDRFLRK